MLATIKQLSPLTAVVFGLAAVTSFPLPFDLSHTMASWISFGALAAFIYATLADKPKE